MRLSFVLANGRVTDAIAGRCGWRLVDFESEYPPLRRTSGTSALCAYVRKPVLVEGECNVKRLKSAFKSMA
jgi:hypothetical protein